MTEPPGRGILLRAGLLLCALLACFARPAARDGVRAASEIASVTLTPLDARQFPRVKAYLDVRDAQGNFVAGLRPDQARILEDGRPLPVSDLDELEPGAQLVVALNPGRPFAIRDGQGFSRYDRLVGALRSWASGQDEPGPEAGEPAGGDDYSLLITGRPETLHLSSAKEWLAALESYQADLRASDARLDVLLRAMDVAGDVSARPGMGRLILFITPPPEGDFSAGLEAIVARARQQGIRIFVWMVSAPEQFEATGAQQLRDLAIGTGGSLFAYSGVEPVPNVEDLMKSMRSTYLLEYDSRATTGGPHQVEVEVRLEGFSAATETETETGSEALMGVVSAPQVFEVNVLPPSAVFVALPEEIIRESRIEEQDTEPDLYPKEHLLDVLVEFPDGFQRPVISMTLYVDGTPAAVISEPPFEQISWDLSGYMEDGGHTLRVEAVDSLGLRSSGQETAVRVNVKVTPKSLVAMFARSGPLIAGLVVVLSGAVLVLVLLLGGRIQPHKIGHMPGTGQARKGFWGGLRSGFRGGFRGGFRDRARRKLQSDPVTQPVRGASASGPDAASPDAVTVPASRHGPAWMDRLQWPQRRMPSGAHAMLVRLADSAEMTVPSPVPIEAEEVVFGRDSAQATFVLDDPSVDPKHARLSYADGRYRVADEGSIAGTWVNYTPVSTEGVNLEHGDLLHIGRVGFRFLVRQPTRIRKPVVKREDRSS